MQKLLCLPCRPMFNSNRSHYTPLNSSSTEPSPCSHLLWLADCREVFPGKWWKDVVRNSYSSFPLFNFFLLCFPPQDPRYHFASSILFTLLSVSFFIHLLQLPFFFLFRLEQYQLTLILFFPHTYLFPSSDYLSLTFFFCSLPFALPLTATLLVLLWTLWAFSLCANRLSYITLSANEGRLQKNIWSGELGSQAFHL